MHSFPPRGANARATQIFVLKAHVRETRIFMFKSRATTYIVPHVLIRTIYLYR